MDLALSGKSVIVVGGGSNIGRSIALLFAKSGAKTAILDIDLTGAQKVAETAKTDGGTAIAVQADVGSLESVQNALAEVEKAFGPPEVLVSGVGWWQPRQAAFLDEMREHMEKEVKLNLWGTINCVQAVLPGMQERGKGSFIVISSDAGRVGEKFQAVYSAAKAGVIALMKALAKEYGPKGVRFNAVCPGMTNPGGPETVNETSSHFRAVQRDPTREKAKEAEERVARKVYPLRRGGRAEDIANAVVYLGSDASSFVTGQTLSVSGGYSMM